MIYDTKMKDFKIRFAERKDTFLILNFIKELAEYENMSDEVIATVALLEENIFNQHKCEVIIGEYRDLPVAFALFFHNFSTFLGRPGIFLEDLFVKPEYRGLGVGSIFLAFLARLTIERGCGRLEWNCLDWNEPSIQFYRKMGSVPMDSWTTYRVHNEALQALASGYKQRLEIDE